MATKGTIIIDENAYEPFADGARKANWKTIRISKADYGTKDPELLAKYGKGRWPFLTRDKTMHKNNPPKGGASAFIIHETAGPRQIDDYKIKLNEFWKSHTNKTLKGKKWTIPIDGETICEDLDQAD